MTTVIVLLCISNVIAWFVIGRHSSTLTAFRKNNIRMWGKMETLDNFQNVSIRNANANFKEITHCIQKHIMPRIEHVYKVTSDAHGDLLTRLVEPRQQINELWDEHIARKKTGTKVKIKRQ